MLRMTIDTNDPDTSRELPIPAELRAKVQRAADILAEMLRKVGEAFEINVRWWFDRREGQNFDVLLSLWVAEGSGDVRGQLNTFSKDALKDDESIRRELWTHINRLIPRLSEEVDRAFERIRENRRTLAAAEE